MANSRKKAKRRAAGPSALRALFLVAIVAVLMAAAFSFAFGVVSQMLGCSGAQGGGGAARQESPYDWSRLSWEGERCWYSQPGKFESHFGVDVSDNHSWVDWDAAANDGVEFALLRMGYRGTTEGGLYEDKRFEENLSDARAAGITVGAYFFSQATTELEALEEANFALDILENIEFDGPIVFDHETSDGGRIAGMGKDEVTACARSFVGYLERAGYEVIIYGNKADLAKIDDDLLETHRIWFAEYGVGHPSTNLPLSFWQYSSKGHVDGIPGVVDMNLWIEPVS